MARREKRLMGEARGIVWRLINIKAIISLFLSRKNKRNIHNPENDLELALYNSLLGNNYLHYGYFADSQIKAEDISLNLLKKSMDDYASLLVSRVKEGEEIIEVGCGMGGLLARFDKQGNRVVGVTPSLSQVRHIAKYWPHIQIYNNMFEELDCDNVGQFDVVINSESFQYIDIKRGIEQVDKLLKQNGRWIMSDYFVINKETHNRSGHIFTEFESAINKAGFVIVEKIDITDNILPTLKYAHLLASNLAIPLADFTAKKFFLRHPFFEYLFAPVVENKLANIRLDTIDADIFKRDKIYLLMTIRRK